METRGYREALEVKPDSPHGGKDGKVSQREQQRISIVAARHRKSRYLTPDRYDRRRAAGESRVPSQSRINV